MPETQKTDEQKREKVREMINQIGTAFMVSTTPDGKLHGRPMANAELDTNWDKIYFATQRQSGKVTELTQDSHVYLGYTNTSGSDWVSVTGKARVIDDKQKNKDVWSAAFKNWFDGPEDPNMVLIEVTPDLAEYWDSGSRVFAVAKMAAAAVTGKHFDMGENEKVKF